MTEIAQLVGKKISEARQIRGLNQDGLAQKLGKSRQAISGWETGKKQIPLDELDKLAHYLDFPIQFFFVEKNIADVFGWEGLTSIIQSFVQDAIRQYTIIQEKLAPEVLKNTNIFLPQTLPLPRIDMETFVASTEFQAISVLEKNQQFQIDIDTIVRIRRDLFLNFTEPDGDQSKC